MAVVLPGIPTTEAAKPWPEVELLRSVLAKLSFLRTGWRKMAVVRTEAKNLNLRGSESEPDIIFSCVWICFAIEQL